MQLDLFLHGRDVVLRNGVVAALHGRDADACRKTLAALAAEYRDDALLPPLTVLCDALASPPVCMADTQTAVAALRHMETVVEPAAARVFGDRPARTWLAPLWRSQAQAAAGLAFDAARPEVHRAALLLRVPDWEAAQTAIAAIASWRRIPAPLSWMAEARFGQEGLAAAWPLLFELAWLDPIRFGNLARRLDAPPLAKLLRDFDANFDAEGESDLAWFPAWALIAEPALAGVARGAESTRDLPPEQAAHLVLQLLILERQGRHAEIVAYRKRLRDLHPGIFARYLRTRGG